MRAILVVLLVSLGLACVLGGAAIAGGTIPTMNPWADLIAYLAAMALCLVAGIIADQR